MKGCKILYERHKKVIGARLIIQDNPLYPESVEVIDVIKGKVNCYLLPKEAILKVAEIITRSYVASKLNQIK